MRRDGNPFKTFSSPELVTTWLAGRTAVGLSINRQNVARPLAGAFMRGDSAAKWFIPNCDEYF
jgi:hypothetical protein